MNAAGRVAPRDREAAAVSTLRSLIEIADADAAILVLSLAADDPAANFVTTYGLRPQSTSGNMSGFFGSLPRHLGAEISAHDHHHSVIDAQTPVATQLREMFDFESEASFERFPNFLRGEPIGETWLLARGAHPPLDDERAALIRALLDLLVVTLCSRVATSELEANPLFAHSHLFDGAIDEATTRGSIANHPETLLDAFEIAVLLIAHDGTIELANHEAERLLGFTTDQLVGTRINSRRYNIRNVDGTPRVSREPLFDIAMRSTETTPQVDFIAQRPDGSQIYLCAWARPIFAPDRVDPMGVAMFLRRSTPGTSESDTQERLAALEYAFARLAPKIGGDPVVTRPAPSDLALLTNRERQVIMLLAAGLRVTNIAEELHLSEHTVRNHLKGIFRKLGVTNQAELVRRLRSGGAEGLR